MRVQRTLEYDGPEEWVKQTLELSYVQSAPRVCGAGKVIEVSREDVDKIGMDLTRADIYPTFTIPDAHVEMALRVLRTIAAAAKEKGILFAELKVTMEVAHRAVVESVQSLITQEKEENNARTRTEEGTADHPTHIGRPD